MSHEKIETNLDQEEEALNQKIIETIKQAQRELDYVQDFLKKQEAKMKIIEMGDYVDDPEKARQYLQDLVQYAEDRKELIQELQGDLLEDLPEDATKH